MQHPIRVGYLDSTSEMGGAEHLLLTLFESLPPDKVQAVLVCPKKGPLVREAKLRGVSALTVSLPPFFSFSFVLGKRKFFNPIALFWNFVSLIYSALRLRKHLTSLDVDLIQTNSILAHLYGGLAARLMGIPCIWYFHDLVERERLAGMTVLVWRILSSLFAERIVGVSAAVIESLSVGSRGHVIYAGVNTQQPAENESLSRLRLQLKLPAEARIVGYVGRIGYVKGLDILLEAAEEIVTKDCGIHFVIFGDVKFGEHSFKQRLVNRVEANGLHPNWHWVGYNPDVRHRIKEIDLLVLPSRREALPLVLLEAAVAGKVAVASRVGGVPEVIIDGVTGILVNPGNHKELASSILSLIKNPPLANKMGKQAQLRVQSLFTLENYYVQFLDLYGTFFDSTSSSLCT